MQQDRVVAEGKERERRATLERVNKMIFHETDSARGFHSAALHCDVLAERSAQIEFKQQVGCLCSAVFAWRLCTRPDTSDHSMLCLPVPDSGTC